MSTNAKFTDISTLTVQVPSGTAPNSPIVIGALKGVAEAVFDSAMKAVSVTTDAAGFATIRIARGSVFTLSVLASTDDTSSPLGGASAVAIGDQLYKNDSAVTVSKDSSGTHALGIALGVLGADTGAYQVGTNLISAGAIASIDVLIQG